MFILCKELKESILEFGEYWQNSIKNEDLFLALISFFFAPFLIVFLIVALISDIVLSPLEIIIYLAVRKVRNERNK